MSEVLTACLILAGCTHANEVQDDPELEVKTKDVKVMILQEPSTRSGINPQTQVGGSGSNSANVSNGYLYFTDSNENILLYRKISKDAQSSGGNIISLNQLKNEGVVIEGTPSEAVYCHVFLNIPELSEFSDSQMAKPSGNISNIGGIALATKSLYDTEGGVGKVPLRGRGRIVRLSNTSASEVNVVMNVIASRIEIAKISTTASILKLSSDGLPYEIKSFTVSGIFINNFFATSQLSGSVNTSSLVFNTAKDVYLGTEDNPNTPYKAYTELYTYSTSTSGISHRNTNPNVFMPPNVTGLDVWGYNVFPNDTNSVKTSQYVPHVIIRFSNLTYYPTGREAEETTVTDRFVTLKGFMSSGAELQYLQKGLVYFLSDVIFSLDEVSEVPEANTMNVKTNVSVIPWLVETIEPVL